MIIKITQEKILLEQYLSIIKPGKTSVFGECKKDNVMKLCSLNLRHKFCASFPGEILI